MAVNYFQTLSVRDFFSQKDKYTKACAWSFGLKPIANSSEIKLFASKKKSTGVAIS